VNVPVYGQRKTNFGGGVARWMPAVPGTMAKALAREALGWASGLIGFDGDSDVKQTIQAKNVFGENVAFDVHKTHRQRLIGSTETTNVFNTELVMFQFGGDFVECHVLRYSLLNHL